MTACDGPMAFLEMMLWSASWSLSQHNDNENGNAVEEDENEGDNGGNEDVVISCPPWIVKDKQQKKKKWRLPNCIISDR